MPNKPLKILVVDDDPAVATAIGRGLRKHEATIETDPESAYRRLTNGEWFDVVVCDTRMPRRGGPQLLAAARALPDPPIFVLMSGDDTVTHVEADATLHKPFNVTHLLDLVTVLSRQKARAATRILPRIPAASGTAR